MTKAERSRELRYKKAIAEGFNLADICSELYNIAVECAEIHYITDGEEGMLIDALDGDEDDAYEFRMMFSELECECEQLQNILNEEYVVECFDDFFCRVSGGAVKRLGYDVYEDDYYSIESDEVLDVSLEKIWIRGGAIDYDELGNVAFFTAEEAEKKRKEIKNA